MCADITCHSQYTTTISHALKLLYSTRALPQSVSHTLSVSLGPKDRRFRRNKKEIKKIMFLVCCAHMFNANGFSQSNSRRQVRAK